MSQPDLINDNVSQRPRPPLARASVYTALLGMSAMCLAVACILLMVKIGWSAEDAGITTGWFGVIK